MNEETATKYYISHFSVEELWGHKKYVFPLGRDMNIIIGPNASGKTTLINILYDVLNGNFIRLYRTLFSEVEIKLTSFDNASKKSIKIERTGEGMAVRIDKGPPQKLLSSTLLKMLEEAGIEEGGFENIKRRMHFARLIGGDSPDEVVSEIRSLVSAVWLPVSRRLPMTEEDDGHRRQGRKRQESVDECLAELVEVLQKYRLSLNTDLSRLRQSFQSHALENILYDSKHDNFDNKKLTPLSESDKKALTKALVDVGFVDKAMEARIEDHFRMADEVIAGRKKRKDQDMFTIQEVSILPLINRTRAIIGFAQDLETKKDELFAPIQTYEEQVNSFLNNKAIRISEKGEMLINLKTPTQTPIEWMHLSSGEKQLLILLTQALISRKSPTVYVADEPELSLHVNWQEKLLSALSKLAGRCQFIVATHSPDIVSGFGDKVIDLGRI